MTYLLDTNAWIRLFADPKGIAVPVLETLGHETEIGLSPMSITEVCQKASVGKLDFNGSLEGWITAAMPDSLIKLLPISAEVPQLAYELNLIHPKTGQAHKDPADLIIAATAKLNKLTLVTSDEVLLEAPEISTLSTR